jgi:hypothetical protein
VSFRDADHDLLELPFDDASDTNADPEARAIPDPNVVRCLTSSRRSESAQRKGLAWREAQMPVV